jgi:aldose sugar dehydrogenase
VSKRTILSILAACVATGAMFATSPSAAADVVAERIQTQYQAIRVTRVAGGLQYPWGIAFLPDGSYLVTERPGRLQHVRDGRATPVAGLPDIQARRQGGLMDVALHPDFENNRWVYLTYSKGNAEATTTALGRGRLNEGRLEDFEEVFVQDRLSEPGRHYGSRIAWLSDGTLLLSIGDRGAAPARAQDPRDHAGKLLRLNDDGSIPADNPFVSGEAAHPEIYSLGHRNIQGLVVAPGTDAIWATEHGERGGDELNLVRPGLNYGWPVVTRSRDYRTQEQYGETRSREGYVEPVWEFLPTLAPSGLAMVTGDRFPNWRGDLLAGGLRSERIHRIVVEDGTVVHQEELLLGLVGRIRDVREGPDGYIYVLSDAADGGVYRIEPFG